MEAVQGQAIISKYVKGHHLVNGSYPSRPFTCDTPYLAQKYRKEGMNAIEIADLLSRPINDIEAALKVELTPDQENNIDIYYHEYQRRPIIE